MTVREKIDMKNGVRRVIFTPETLQEQLIVGGLMNAFATSLENEDTYPHPEDYRLRRGVKGITRGLPPKLMFRWRFDF